MIKKITTETIEKDLGWTKYQDGIYAKTPYPFTLNYNLDAKAFKIKDLFFPEFIQYKSYEKLETIEDYEKLVIPILKITAKATNDQIFDYKIACLISSYKEVVKLELEKIDNLDATIKENHIRTFIEYSFGNGDPIFKITTLQDFLNLEKDDGSLKYFKSRYMENKEVFDKIEYIILKTKEHLRTIYSSATPNSQH